VIVEYSKKKGRNQMITFDSGLFYCFSQYFSYFSAFILNKMA